MSARTGYYVDVLVKVVKLRRLRVNAITSAEARQEAVDRVGRDGEEVVCINEVRHHSEIPQHEQDEAEL